jgi:hypothetical protein
MIEVILNKQEIMEDLNQSQYGWLGRNGSLGRRRNLLLGLLFCAAGY